MDKSQVPVIAGFEIFGKLGEGGMGQVWRARQISLDRMVALKILPPRPVADPAETARFLQEARTAAQLKHQGIVQVYDAGEQGGGWHIVMEYVNGYSAGQLLRRKGRIGPEDALTIGEYVAEALRYAWEQAGIVHCDLKPENILIDEDGTVKVADLGLARMLGHGGLMADYIAGTPNYMAPEQAAGAADLDCRADIFALGATLYQLASGELPFKGLSAEEILRRKSAGQTGIEPAVLAQIPRLSELIAKMTNVRREDRFADWPGVLDAIGLVWSDKEGKVHGSVVHGSTVAAFPKKLLNREPFDAAGIKLSRRSSAEEDRAFRRLEKKKAGRESEKAIWRGILATVIILGAVIGGVWLKRQADQNVLVPPRPLEGGGGKVVVKPPEKPDIPPPPPENPLEDQDVAPTAETNLPPEPEKTPPAKPQIAVSSPDILAATGGPPHQILWQAGKLNGRPTDAFDGLIADEYKEYWSEEPVVHIRQPEDFRQAIKSGQSFVVHLGALEAQGCVLRLALTSGIRKPGEDYRNRSCDAEGRVLRVGWNNRLLWRRWLAPGHVVAEIFVPAWVFSKEDNLLTIENEGQQTLFFDAVWLEKYRPGPQMFAALEDAAWVGKEAAQRTPVCVLNLPTPDEADLIETNAIAFERRRQAPGDYREAIAAWPTLPETDSFLTVGTNPLPAKAQIWQAELAQALRRGMLPITAVQAGGSEKAWKLWAQRFGPLIGYWILSGEPEAVSAAAEAIRERVSGAHIILNAPLESLAGQNAADLESLIMQRAAGSSGWRTDTVPGELRAAAWQNSDSFFSREPFDQWLQVRPIVSDTDIHWQRKQAVWLAEAMLQWWMAGGNKLIVSGGGVGGFLFPDATGAPSLAWDAIRLLLQLGEGRSSRSAANLIPTEGTAALADTYWAAANNSSNLVTLVVFANRDRERSVEVNVPVPWTGETVVRIESVQLHAQLADPVSLPGVNLKANAGGAWKQVEPGGTTEWATASFPLTLAGGVQLLRLTPAGTAFTGRPMALPDQAPPDLPLFSGLFRVMENPLPQDLRLILLRNPSWPADSLCETYQRKIESATPGTIPAWNLEAGAFRSAITNVKNVAPWSRQSEAIYLPAATGKVERPQGIRLWLDNNCAMNVKWLALWMRINPIEPARTNATPSAYPERTVSLQLGLEDKMERVRLATNTWQLILAQLPSVSSNIGRIPGYLTLRSDPGSKKNLRCEINAIFALCADAGPNRQLGSVAGYAQWDKGKTNLLVALLGVADKPGQWHGRLPMPVQIEKMSIDAVIADKERGEKSEANEKKEKKPTGSDNVTYRYHPESQILEIGMGEFPEMDQKSLEWARSMFPGLPPCRSDTESLLLLRFSTRQ